MSDASPILIITALAAMQEVGADSPWLTLVVFTAIGYELAAKSKSSAVSSNRNDAAVAEVLLYTAVGVAVEVTRKRAAWPCVAGAVIGFGLAYGHSRVKLAPADMFSDE